MSFLKVRDVASFTNCLDANAYCEVILTQLDNRDGIIYTFPNISATITANSIEQSLTNKTIAGNTNIVHATHLQTTGDAVNVSNASPPVECSFLKATSATNAEWVTLDQIVIEANVIEANLLCINGEIQVDNIFEKTLENGVSIEGVNIKDSSVLANTIV